MDYYREGGTTPYLRLVLFEKPSLGWLSKYYEYTVAKQVRRFLGLASYYRQFVPGLAHIASPLYALLKKDAVFNSTVECQDAFVQLKNLLVSAPVLAYPQFHAKHPFILETMPVPRALKLSWHKSKRMERFTLLHLHHDPYPPMSVTMLSQLETLGLVWAAKLFHPYLLGHCCVAFTDHAACTSFLNSRNPSSKMVWWAVVIQELNLDIFHRSGKSNYVANDFKV